MTTTSRGLGAGPGPTPASSKRRERIMSQKIHEEGSLCRWGGDGPRLVNVPRNDSGHGHDARREVEWDARPQVLEGRRRTHRPRDCHDAAQSLLSAHLYAVLVAVGARSEEHTSELQSQSNLVCRLLLEKKNNSRRRSRYVPSCATRS